MRKRIPAEVRNQAIKPYMEDGRAYCAACGMFPETKYELHHVRPLVKGGEDTAENLVPLCGICHRHAPDDEAEFAAYIRAGGYLVSCARLIAEKLNAAGLLTVESAGVVR